MYDRCLDTVGGGYISGSLFHKIISIENLFCAWKAFKRGKNKNLDVQNFAFALEDNIFSLHFSLKERNWIPDAYVGFYIKDPKLRHIHKATVRDRVLHQAVFQILDPFFDEKFIPHSFSSRVGKGTLAGVDALESFGRKVSRNWKRPVYALSCDIRKFFDSVDHTILEALVARTIHDDEAMSLIRTIIRSFYAKPGIGIPLGNVTSQLFANVYLNEVDQFSKQGLDVRYYARYCDDFVFVSDSVTYLERLIPLLSRFLENSLHLELHPNKIEIHSFRQGIDFLGYVIRPHHRVFRTRTKRRMFKKMKSAKEWVANGTMEEKTFQAMAHSYRGMLSHARSYGIRQKLDALVPHR